MNLPHLTFLFLLVATVVSLMMLAGMTKNTLELKRTRRICPSCGRATRDCTCRLRRD